MKSNWISRHLGAVITFLTLLTINSLFAYAGTKDGGGGGGLKINGKVYSLSEAGLRIDEDAPPFYLDVDTINETEKILKVVDNLSPTRIKGQFRDLIFSNKHTYRKVEVVDQKLFDKMKAEYAKFIKALNVQGDFVLPAFYLMRNLLYLNLISRERLPDLG